MNCVLGAFHTTSLHSPSTPLREAFYRCLCFMDVTQSEELSWRPHSQLVSGRAEILFILLILRACHAIDPGLDAGNMMMEKDVFKKLNMWWEANM